MDGGHAEKQRGFDGTSQKTAVSPPPLRHSPRGGKLYAGGVRGNRGGTGRPITHGRYSKRHTETLGSLAENLAAVEDPLSLLPELALLRAHYVDFINRCNDKDGAVANEEVQQSASRRPKQLLNPADGVRILSEISKVVKRIESIRGRKVITKADFHRVMQEIGRVVERVLECRVADLEQCAAIKSEISKGWREIRLA